MAATEAGSVGYGGVLAVLPDTEKGAELNGTAGCGARVYVDWQENRIRANNNQAREGMDKTACTTGAFSGRSHVAAGAGIQSGWLC